MKATHKSHEISGSFGPSRGRKKVKSANPDHTHNILSEFGEMVKETSFHIKNKESRAHKKQLKLSNHWPDAT
jgi:hypothetical protein